MNNRLTVGIITVIVLALGIFVYINISGADLSSLFTKKGKVTIDNHTFSVFEAKTEKEKQIGLSGRSGIADNQGMIFVFDKADSYGFWMKNMKFPIDIVYLKDQKVISIFDSVPNPKTPLDQLPIYTPSEPADTVIEFKAGTVKKDNIKVGDTASISL